MVANRLGAAPADLRRRLGPSPAFVGAVALALLLAPSSRAVTVSPDVTADLSGTTLADEDAGDDDLAGTVTPVALGALPAATDLNAYHLEVSGTDQLISFDTTVSLPGGVTAGPSDVVTYDGVLYGVIFDGLVEGVPPGVVIDAVGRESGGELLLSFDTTVDLGGGLIVDDEDVVSWDGIGFSSVFDGSAEGVAAELDVDAIHRIDGTGNLGMSFDLSGVVGGVGFDDEDVLEYDVGGGTWSMSYDGSAEHAGWVESDLDAVYLPEPGAVVCLAAGLSLIAALHRRRDRPGIGSPLPRGERLIV